MKESSLKKPGPQTVFGNKLKASGINLRVKGNLLNTIFAGLAIDSKYVSAAALCEAYFNNTSKRILKAQSEGTLWYIG